MSKRLKLAFDPTGIWDREDFRNIIKEMVLNPDFEVYLITKNTVSSFISTVLSTAGMSENMVFQVVNDDAVVAKLDLLQIRMYMSADNPLIRLVDAHSEWAVGVLVNNIVDNRKSQMMYITKLQFWINRIEIEINGQDIT